MAGQEHFAQLLQRACRNRGWDLLPTGIRVGWPNGRRQLIELRYFQLKSDELVRLSTTIGNAEGMSATRLSVALRTNADLAHGCLAIHEDHLVMTDTLLLRDAGCDVIEASISYLAETADHYERTFFGTDQY